MSTFDRIQLNKLDLAFILNLLYFALAFLVITQIVSVSYS